MAIDAVPGMTRRDGHENLPKATKLLVLMAEVELELLERGGRPQLPIWEWDGRAASLIDLEPPVSQGLGNELVAWCNQYEDWFYQYRVWHGDGGNGFMAPADPAVQVWLDRGRALRSRLQDELGPGHKVGYYNEVENIWEWPDAESEV